MVVAGIRRKIVHKLFSRPATGPSVAHFASSSTWPRVTPLRVDGRGPGEAGHTLADLIGQRVFGIACGHPDGNDADHLADDPIHKLLLGRDPVSGAPLASQPTISAAGPVSVVSAAL